MHVLCEDVQYINSEDNDIRCDLSCCPRTFSLEWSFQALTQMASRYGPQSLVSLHSLHYCVMLEKPLSLAVVAGPTPQTSPQTDCYYFLIWFLEVAMIHSTAVLLHFLWFRIQILQDFLVKWSHSSLPSPECYSLVWFPLIPLLLLWVTSESSPSVYTESTQTYEQSWGIAVYNLPHKGTPPSCVLSPQDLLCMTSTA